MNFLYMNVPKLSSNELDIDMIILLAVFIIILCVGAFYIFKKIKKGQKIKVISG